MKLVVYALEHADAKKLAATLEAKGHEVVAVGSGTELGMIVVVAKNPSYGIRAVVTEPKFADQFRQLGLNTTH